MAIITAAVNAEVVAQVRGDYDLQLEETVPAFFLSETDRVLAVGSEDWEAALKRVGFSLVAIAFAEWAPVTVLAALRGTFPTIEAAVPDRPDSTP